MKKPLSKSDYLAFAIRRRFRKEICINDTANTVTVFGEKFSSIIFIGKGIICVSMNFRGICTILWQTFFKWLVMSFLFSCYPVCRLHFIILIQIKKNTYYIRFLVHFLFPRQLFKITLILFFHSMHTNGRIRKMQISDSF